MGIFIKKDNEELEEVRTATSAEEVKKEKRGGFKKRLLLEKVIEK